jgi:RimJ/RimL family protein N-acetyltransferase
MALTFPITTDRLRLRPFTVSDLDDAFVYLSDPAVVRYLPWPVRDLGESRRFLEQRAKKVDLVNEGDGVILAIELPTDGHVIGEVMLRWLSNEHRQGELGYVLNPRYEGHGYATEAARAALRLGFEHYGLHRIIANLDVLNTASARLVERLGMRREAHFVHNEIFKGDWGDMYVYAMLETEWKR